MICSFGYASVVHGQDRPGGSGLFLSLSLARRYIRDDHFSAEALDSRFAIFRRHVDILMPLEQQLRDRVNYQPDETTVLLMSFFNQESRGAVCDIEQQVSTLPRVLDHFLMIESCFTDSAGLQHLQSSGNIRRLHEFLTTLLGYMNRAEELVGRYKQLQRELSDAGSRLVRLAGFAPLLQADLQKDADTLKRINTLFQESDARARLRETIDAVESAMGSRSS